MAMCQRDALDSLRAVVIGGLADRDLGEMLLMYTCIRQNARQSFGDRQISALILAAIAPWYT